MKIYSDFSLKAHNTFGLDQKVEAFVRVQTENELKLALGLKEYSTKFILGGGSNLLLTKPVMGLCIFNDLKGLSVFQENEEDVIIEAMAGENWHELVIWSLEQGYGGLENLSLIPGNVGTAPIQNIGAYGVELKDVFHSCIALDRTTGEEKEFQLEDVQFAYRSSIFKTHAKGQYAIVKVRMRLTKKKHRLRYDYGAIREALGDNSPSPKEISKAVISIRQEKLPDPKVLGNSGSFFKNPLVAKATYNELKKRYPDLPAYPTVNTQMKVPAGWMIENLGWKGYRKGDAGVHKNQALVLVNYGSATGKEILDLAVLIQQDVEKNFGMRLEPEVNIF